MTFYQKITKIIFPIEFFIKKIYKIFYNFFEFFIWNNFVISKPDFIKKILTYRTCVNSRSAPWFFIFYNYDSAEYLLNL